MYLTPIFRDSMRSLRAAKLEKQRNERLDKLVSVIYNQVVITAENTDDSKHLYMLDNADSEGMPDDFNRINMALILNRVRSLFPESSVEYVTDEKPTKEYIVVDWS